MSAIDKQHIAAVKKLEQLGYANAKLWWNCFGNQPLRS
jgi:hypothetical protein